LGNDSVKNGGRQTKAGRQGGNNDELTVSRWKVTTSFGIFFRSALFHHCPWWRWYPFEIGLHVPSWRAIYVRFASQICYYWSTKSIILYERKDSVSVPIYIIIITNESIGSDRIPTFSPTGTEYMECCTACICLGSGVVFILHQVDVPNMLVLHNKSEHRPINLHIWLCHPITRQHTIYSTALQQPNLHCTLGPSGV